MTMKQAIRRTIQAATVAGVLAGTFLGGAHYGGRDLAARENAIVEHVYRWEREAYAEGYNAARWEFDRCREDEIQVWTGDRHDGCVAEDDIEAAYAGGWTGTISELTTELVSERR